MRVSVILPMTPAYAEFVPAAQRSIKNQSILVEMVSFTALGNVAQATNEGAREASGEYIMRLDCDDYLHPLAAEIMLNYLDAHADVAAVYSDYWEIDENGTEGDIISQRVPPHPGCMMIRKDAFERVSGFDESLSRQEGADFYYRLAQVYSVKHLNIPLWYYRRHDKQMSNSHNEVIKARHEIKELHRKQSEKILALIPARGGSKGIPRKNLVLLNGQPLIVHAIKMAKKSKHDILICVSTEDDEIASVAECEGVQVMDRPISYARDNVDLITVAKHSMEAMDKTFRADIVVTIQPTAPFTPVSALDNALTSLIETPDLDAVVSMSEVIGKHPYRMYRQTGDQRYTPFFENWSECYLQRQDRPKAYQFTGGFYARRRRLLERWTGKGFALGSWEGELVSPQPDIDTPMDLWLARAMMEHQEDL
jgi:CMP-N-acetylneuraminic acid synthetase